MPIASLNRFTVPLSTDQSSAVQGLLMPKLKYRFRVTLDNFGVAGTPSTELTKQVMNVTRPDVTFADITLNVYNSTVKLAGKPTFANATLTLRDDVTGATTRKVGEQLQKQLDFMEQSSASSGIDYKFLTRFEVLDGGNGANAPIALETWEIYGCYLSEVNYNNMDYGASEAATISLTVRFDNAIQTPVGSGVGAIVGRTLGDVATGAGNGLV